MEEDSWLIGEMPFGVPDVCRVSEREFLAESSPHTPRLPLQQQEPQVSHERCRPHRFCQSVPGHPGLPIHHSFPSSSSSSICWLNLSGLSSHMYNLRMRNLPLLPRREGCGRASLDLHCLECWNTLRVAARYSLVAGKPGLSLLGSWFISIRSESKSLRFCERACQNHGDIPSRASDNIPLERFPVYGCVKILVVALQHES